MKKVTFAALAALTITACSSGPKFQVNGDVSGADGKMLYLEASGLEGIVPLDSVKLKGEGTFSFKQARPESPEFYRLRIDDKVINFSVDSIETVQIKAPYVDFSTDYTVEGSENSNKIKLSGVWLSLARALDLGSRGRRFESCHPDFAGVVQW